MGEALTGKEKNQTRENVEPVFVTGLRRVEIKGVLRPAVDWICHHHFPSEGLRSDCGREGTVSCLRGGFIIFTTVWLSSSNMSPPPLSHHCGSSRWGNILSGGPLRSFSLLLLTNSWGGSGVTVINVCHCHSGHMPDLNDRTSRQKAYVSSRNKSEQRKVGATFTASLCVPTHKRANAPASFKPDVWKHFGFPVSRNEKKRWQTDERSRCRALLSTDAVKSTPRHGNTRLRMSASDDDQTCR